MRNPLDPPAVAGGAPGWVMDAANARTYQPPHEPYRRAYDPRQTMTVQTPKNQQAPLDNVATTIEHPPVASVEARGGVLPDDQPHTIAVTPARRYAPLIGYSDTNAPRGLPKMPAAARAGAAPATSKRPQENPPVAAGAAKGRHPNPRQVYRRKPTKVVVQIGGCEVVHEIPRNHAATKRKSYALLSAVLAAVQSSNTPLFARDVADQIGPHTAVKLVSSALHRLSLWGYVRSTGDRRNSKKWEACRNV